MLGERGVEQIILSAVLGLKSRDAREHNTFCGFLLKTCGVRIGARAVT